MEVERRHRLELTERQKLLLEGVQKVESFTDAQIDLETNMGFLILSGDDLHITQLNLDEGMLVVEGLFSGIQYSETAKGGRQRAKGFLNRILK
ncbi:MAG: sporulation protein YabP [Peptococcaceae bacterium]|nr:sporulation protein YabP [Peptococcaceae bacterium]